MKKALLYIWQLPQVLLAWIMILVNTALYGKPETKDYKDVKYMRFEKWKNGISLGQYILLGGIYKQESTVMHEYGHARQSRYFGPLYLILIGIPSGLGNLWCRIFDKDAKWYYSLPWEKWADKLGGVTRKFN